MHNDPSSPHQRKPTVFPASLTTLQRTDSTGRPRWVTFLEPCGVLQTERLEEVLPVLEGAVAARNRGLHAVGSISYEASAAFDPHFRTHPLPPGVPLLRFTLFRSCREGIPTSPPAPFEVTDLRPGLSPEAFCRQVGVIHEAIAAGETYQVNFTYPWTARVNGDARSLFRRMRLAQAAPQQAYLEEADRILISASPERFFRLENGHIVCRPMKGTGKPGEEAPLQESIKNRAENVMIVDMIRNDLGQVAEVGSVKVSDLFRIESYPSLVQMTSAVTARGPEDPLPWLQALFPCASITGAPKRRTMEWIHRLESGPRNVYTGCIGGFYADGCTEFNVAIRTLCLDRATGKGIYGTGCGIVWDSDPEAECRESVLKTAVLSHREPEVQLIETMRCDPGTGIRNLAGHLTRLTRSANELGYETDLEQLHSRLREVERECTGTSRCRLTLSPDGNTGITLAPAPESSRPMTFRVDTVATPSTHPSLRHKTTSRDIYDQARERHPDVEETLLINERGECMEFCIGNLLLEKSGSFYTPHQDAGLLNGTCRSQFLAHGAEEIPVTRKTLAEADQIYLINAVRGKVPMIWVEVTDSLV